MATKTKRKPSKRRKPPSSSLFAKRKKPSNSESVRYLIKYCYPAAPDRITEEFDLPPAKPRRVSPAGRARVTTMRLKVRGEANMKIQRAALRSAGTTILSVQKLGWFG